MQAPRVSIVTGTWNREACMKRLVESIVRCSPDQSVMPWELIVSDASDPVYDPSVWPKSPIVTKILSEHPRLGCTGAYNRAFREARGTWVIWLNDDCEVQPGWMSSSVAFMEAHPTVGLGCLFWRDFHELKWHVNKAYWDVYYANFGIISKTLGDRLGWFDSDLEMYGCDTSLAYKTWLAGFGVVGIPDAKVLHYRHKDQYRKANQDSVEKDTNKIFDNYLPWKDRIQSVALRFSSVQPPPEVPA